MNQLAEKLQPLIARIVTSLVTELVPAVQGAMREQLLAALGAPPPRARHAEGKGSAAHREAEDSTEGEACAA